MKKIKVLIIDDEPRAHVVLESYIEKTPQLELVGNCYNAVEAYAFLKTTPVDLLFLDITMPEVSGFSLLKMLKSPPHVIFTTAHSEFAVESYEYNAIDYLKKPIPADRFNKAISKLEQWINKGVSTAALKDNIELKINGEQKTIPLNQILYVQSLGNYVKVYLETGKVLITQITTKELEDSLGGSSMIRIHKSYIINRAKISQVFDEELMIGNARLPIGKTFKKYVREVVNAKS